jgi:hypothetical protein
MSYCLGLAPRLAPDFIRSFIIGTSDSAHSRRRIISNNALRRHKEEKNG